MFDPKSLPNLSGRVFIVTGGNTGIGFVTCHALANKEAKVYMAARSPEKATKAIADIKSSHPSAEIYPLIMDHTDLASVASAADTFLAKERQLNGLVLNGGIMNYPYSLTKDGFEIQMQSNYLAHWLLTRKLMPVLQATARVLGAGSARIVSVTSGGHAHFGVKGILYNPKEVEVAGPYNRYGQSKLANILFAKTLHSQCGPGSASANAGKGEIWTAACHPGFASTQLNEHNRDVAHWTLKWIYPVLKFLGIITPWERACISNTFVAAGPDFKASMSGEYFWDDATTRPGSEAARNMEERDKLEEWTEEEMHKRDFID